MTPPSRPRDAAPWMVAGGIASPGSANGTANGNANAAGKIADANVIVQKTPLPQLRVKMLFNAGSASDPSGKEGSLRSRRR